MSTIDPASFVRLPSDLNDAAHATRVAGLATQLNEERNRALQQKNGWMAAEVISLILFLVAVVGVFALSDRPTRSDLDNAVKREVEKTAIANAALQICQNKLTTVCPSQSAAQPDSYDRGRDTGILLERSAQIDRKVDILGARPAQLQSTTLQATRPAVVPSAKGKASTPPSGVGNTIPQAHLNKIETSNECRFVAKGSGGVVNLVLRNLEGKVSILQVKDFKNASDGRHKYTKAELLSGPKKTPFTSGNCSSNQEAVRKSWSEVVKGMNLPDDCKPF